MVGKIQAKRGRVLKIIGETSNGCTPANMKGDGNAKKG